MEDNTNIMVALNLRTDVEYCFAGGGSLPHRDEDGNRTYLPGEMNLTQRKSEQIAEGRNTISQEDETINTAETEKRTLGECLASNTVESNKRISEAEAERQRIKEQIDRIDQMNIPEFKPAETDDAKIGRTSEKVGSAKSIIIFIVAAFIAEVVTMLATMPLMHNTLDTASIWWRMAYAMVIYLFSILLFFRYQKTRRHPELVKWTLIGCLLMSLACLVHSIVVSFISPLTTNSEAVNYSLGAIESGVAAGAAGNGSFWRSILFAPGLSELVIATAMFFLGEILSLTHDKSEKTDAPVADTPSTAVIDFVRIKRLTLIQEKERLVTRMNQLVIFIEEEFNKIKAFTFSTQKRIEILEDEINQARKKKEEASARLSNLATDMVHELEEYRESFLDLYALRLGGAPCAYNYEPCTLNDIVILLNLTEIIPHIN